MFAGSGASETLVSVTVPTIASIGQQGGGKGMVGPGGTDMVGYGAAVNVHWGRWVDGTVTDDSGARRDARCRGGGALRTGDQLALADGLIAAKNGAFSYNVVIGGTNPTDNSGNIGTFGGGSVNVNFTNRTAALTAAWNVGGSNYSVSALPGTINLQPGRACGGRYHGRQQRGLVRWFLRWRRRRHHRQGQGGRHLPRPDWTITCRWQSAAPRNADHEPGAAIFLPDLPL